MTSSLSFRKRIEQSGLQSDRLLHLPLDERIPFPWLDLERDLRVRAEGDLVLYLPVQARRATDSVALAYAILAASSCAKPLLICESLSPFYPWASARPHRFLLEAAAERTGTQPGYLLAPRGRVPEADSRALLNAFPDPSAAPESAFPDPFVERGEDGPNAELLKRLVQKAAVVISDWHPAFVVPAFASHLKHLAAGIGVELLLVDDSGLVPLTRWRKAEAAARWIRPKLRPWIDASINERQSCERLSSAFTNWLVEVPAELLGPGSCFGRAAGKAGETQLNEERIEALIAESGVSQEVAPACVRGGHGEAQRLLDSFLAQGLSLYAAERAHPDAACGSRMSAYLHFGMIHPRELVGKVFDARKVGSLEALERADPTAAKFVDGLCTWRELGLNMAHFAYARVTALGSVELVPAWAQKTLRQHLPPESECVSLERLEAALSPDPVWNAAQCELRETGLIHNYLRMLWGKGILRWSSSPEEALRRLEYLNNKYAIDGCDPNSYLNFHWCLGKFDRPWPPARPPFGIVRSMSTAAARRKLKMTRYLKTWIPEENRGEESKAKAVEKKGGTRGRRQREESEEIQEREKSGGGWESR